MNAKQSGMGPANRLAFRVSLFLYAVSFLLPALDAAGESYGLANKFGNAGPLGFIGRWAPADREGPDAVSRRYAHPWNSLLLGAEAFFCPFIHLPFSSHFVASWLANPLYWLGVFCVTRSKFDRARSWAMLAVAIGLATTALLYWRLATSNAPNELRPLVGYFAWLASFLLLLYAVWTPGRRHAE